MVEVKQAAKTLSKSEQEERAKQILEQASNFVPFEDFTGEVRNPEIENPAGGFELKD